MDHGFQGREQDEMPPLPDDFRATVAERYVELYERVTGRSFSPDVHPNPEQRIRGALEEYTRQEARGA
jgi:phosphoribosylaminoimidazole-succinocarboxamide synthase